MLIRDGVFRTASSSEKTNCVAVTALPQGGVQVRDSADPGGPVLTCTDQQWRNFMEAIKRGQLDPSP